MLGRSLERDLDDVVSVLLKKAGELSTAGARAMRQACTRAMAMQLTAGSAILLTRSRLLLLVLLPRWLQAATTFSPPRRTRRCLPSARASAKAARWRRCWRRAWATRARTCAAGQQHTSTEWLLVVPAWRAWHPATGR